MADVRHTVLRFEGHITQAERDRYRDEAKVTELVERIAGLSMTLDRAEAACEGYRDALTQIMVRCGRATSRRRR